MDDDGGRRGLGALGEECAVSFVRELGYVVLERNWRARRGEVDIVARDGVELVIIEVKTRRSDAFGAPEEAVTATKRAALAALAELYCRAAGWHGPYRIDVISVMMAPGAAPEICHFKAIEQA